MFADADGADVFSHVPWTRKWYIFFSLEGNAHQKKRSNCKKRALDSKIARHAKNARNVLKMSKHHLLPHKPAAHFAVDKNAL